MNSCLFYDQITGKDETSDTDIILDLVEDKVKQKDSHESCINLPKENEDASNNFESLKCFDKSTRNRTGKFGIYAFAWNFIKTITHLEAENSCFENHTSNASEVKSILIEPDKILIADEESIYIYNIVI